MCTAISVSRLSSITGSNVEHIDISTLSLIINVIDIPVPGNILYHMRCVKDYRFRLNSDS